jgi:hypothetical protein
VAARCPAAEALTFAHPTLTSPAAGSGISLMPAVVDFGVTQVVDGNWGIHAIPKKSLFAGANV